MLIWIEKFIKFHLTHYEIPQLSSHKCVGNLVWVKEGELIIDVQPKGISWDEHETANANGQTIATQVFKKGVIKVVASRDSSAFITQSDLLATNGVIHVIDAVI